MLVRRRAALSQPCVHHFSKKRGIHSDGGRTAGGTSNPRVVPNDRDITMREFAPGGGNRHVDYAGWLSSALNMGPEFRPAYRSMTSCCGAAEPLRRNAAPVAVVIAALITCVPGRISARQRRHPAISAR